MKSFIALTALILSTQAFAERVTCHADTFVTSGEHGKADAEISFELNRKTKTISNVKGHIFVQAIYAESEEINTEESYMGFFSFAKLAHNPNYRPLKYKGHTQFKNFDAAHTAGQESGMWGSLVIDLESRQPKFDAHYIFQAGDHIGGTVLFTCR